MNSVTDTALSLAEDAVEAAIEVASDVANDAGDLAAELAVPAVAYGTKRLMRSRVAIMVLLAVGATAGLFAWKRRGNDAGDHAQSSAEQG